MPPPGRKLPVQKNVWPLRSYSANNFGCTPYDLQEFLQWFPIHIHLQGPFDLLEDCQASYTLGSGGRVPIWAPLLWRDALDFSGCSEEPCTISFKTVENSGVSLWGRWERWQVLAKGQHGDETGLQGSQVTLQIPFFASWYIPIFGLVATPYENHLVILGIDFVHQ